MDKMLTRHGVRKRYLLARSRVQPRQTVRLPAGEGQLTVDLRDPRGLRIATWGAAHLQGLAFQAWLRLLEAAPWGAVIDVGANYGEFAVPAARRHGRCFMAIEPSPSVAGYLRSSVADVNLASVVVCCAAGRQTGTAWLETLGGSGTARTTTVRVPPNARDRHRIVVPVVPIDDLVAAEPTVHRGSPVLVKMDIEGAELDALAGAERLLAQSDTVAILVETEHVGLDALRKALPDHAVHGLDQRSGQPVRLGPDTASRSAVSTRDVIFTRSLDVSRLSW